MTVQNKFTEDTSCWYFQLPSQNTMHYKLSSVYRNKVAHKM